jgi:hypothetical protein
MERSFDLSAMQHQGGGMPTGALLFVLAVSLFMVVASWKIYTKAGQPGWAVLVPIYNLVVLLQIVRKPMWWIVMFLIPIVNFIFCILLYVELAKAFGKSVAFAVGLLLLGIVFLPILAFGSARYQYGDAAPGTA